MKQQKVQPITSSHLFVAWTDFLLIISIIILTKYPDIRYDAMMKV